MLLAVRELERARVHVLGRQALDARRALLVPLQVLSTSRLSTLHVAKGTSAVDVVVRLFLRDAAQARVGVGAAVPAVARGSARHVADPVRARQPRAAELALRTVFAEERTARAHAALAGTDAA